MLNGGIPAQRTSVGADWCAHQRMRVQERECKREREREREKESCTRIKIHDRRSCAQMARGERGRYASFCISVCTHAHRTMHHAHVCTLTTHHAHVCTLAVHSAPQVCMLSWCACTHLAPREEPPFTLTPLPSPLTPLSLPALLSLPPHSSPSPL